MDMDSLISVLLASHVDLDLDISSENIIPGYKS